MQQLDRIAFQSSARRVLCASTMPKKKAPSEHLAALEQTLTALAATDPRAAIVAVGELQDAKERVEEVAFRTAFERVGWFESPAADLLGIARSSLQTRIGPKGRHRAIGEDAKRHRAENPAYSGHGPRPKK